MDGDYSTVFLPDLGIDVCHATWLGYTFAMSDSKLATPFF